jgi:hypothetical protein
MERAFGGFTDVLKNLAGLAGVVGIDAADHQHRAGI